MQTVEQVQAFARAWIDGWNALDLAGILSHYSEDVVFRSPRIALVTGEPIGLVVGKAGLESYWTRALALAPDLHFELDHVYTGRETVTIAYRNHRGQHAAETMIFNAQGLIQEAVATYR